MKFFSSRFFTFSLALPICVAALASSSKFVPVSLAVPQRSSAFAERLHIPGLSGVGKVNDFLYRGSQPNEEGMRELKKLGITTIIDLRGERQGTVKTERQRAKALGIHVVNIRASGWSPPRDQELVEFFQLIQKRPREKLYVHCWLGDDRTGVFLAAYRIAFEHWSPEQALQEMYYFHFKGFWHPSMKSYILNFPGHFASNAAFAQFRKHSSPARADEKRR